MPERITREQFEAQYAERSHLTVDQLHADGEVAIPSDDLCEWEGCEGWHMQLAEGIYLDRDFNPEQWAYVLEHYPAEAARAQQDGDAFRVRHPRTSR